MTKYTVTAVNYFNGARRHSTRHSISTARGLVRIAGLAGEGWGKRLEMSAAAARALGAYETNSGQWVINDPNVAAVVEITEAQS